MHDSFYIFKYSQGGCCMKNKGVGRIFLCGILMMTGTILNMHRETNNKKITKKTIDKRESSNKNISPTKARNAYKDSHGSHGSQNNSPVRRQLARAAHFSCIQGKHNTVYECDGALDIDGSYENDELTYELGENGNRESRNNVVRSQKELDDMISNRLSMRIDRPVVNDVVHTDTSALAASAVFSEHNTFVAEENGNINNGEKLNDLLKRVSDTRTQLKEHRK